MRYLQKINQSSDAARILHDYMTDLDHEEMWGIFLTSDNGLITQEMLTKGTLRATPIDTRTVIKRSLMNNASGVIIVHNHPSGNPLPSATDIRETKKVREACDLMDISLLDHIVMAGDSFYSFADEKTNSFSKSNQ